MTVAPSQIENQKFKIKNSSPLALLVLGVGADHAHHALAVDDLAVVAHLLDRSPNLHLTSPLPARAGSLVAVRDAPAVQVARQNAYEVLAHLARDVREHLVLTVLQLDAKHGVWQRLDDFRHHLYRFFFRHGPARVSSSKPA